MQFSPCRLILSDINAGWDGSDTDVTRLRLMSERLDHSHLYEVYKISFIQSQY